MSRRVDSWLAEFRARCVEERAVRWLAEHDPVIQQCTECSRLKNTAAGVCWDCLFYRPGVAS